MNLLEAAKKTAPEASDFILAAVRGDEALYAFGGNPLLMAEVAKKLLEHVSNEIKKQ